MSSKSFVQEGSTENFGFAPERLKRLHDRIEQYVDDGQYAGVSVLLVRYGKVEDFFSAGYRDVDRQVEMGRDTILRVYSMTKIVVSVAALTLLEQGKIGLRDPITAYLPEFADPYVMVSGTVENPVLAPADRTITVQHLFTHTSGLTHGDSGLPVDKLYEAADLQTADSLAELVHRIAKVPLGRQPGTIFDYGYSTDVLGRLIEVVTGTRLDVVLQERILEPLEMRDTGYAVPVSKRQRLSKMYLHGIKRHFEAEDLPSGESEEGVRQYPMGGIGLFSTLDDFGRFGQMLCNGGELHGVRILGRKTVDLMTINHLASLGYPYQNCKAGDGFGLGVGVRVDDDLVGTVGTKGMFGWDGLATTRLRIDPVEKLVMVFGAQHQPFDEHGMHERLQNLVYQALI
jgi:CubicO group peptidase (beta-lactamase class C family)